MARLKYILFVFVFIGFLFFKTNVFAQSSCTTPGTPANVLITYPVCEGANCNFTQAQCTWEAATSVATYAIVVTEVDSGTIVKSETLASSVLTYTFAVTNNKTYKCDVTAVNSCGTAGATGTYSLLCQTDVVNPTSTPVPTAPPVVVPTDPPVVVIPPKSQPPASGNEFGFMMLGAISLVLFMGGILLLF
ncbi:MAG: hypothetical protein AUK12_01850 [Candidatus Levybacteria bacterium CG2_30_37_29]|nr:MAG: hypothetical protein AUK12_01850 [Candidatus Levybacteria bacterium CG2_30_37_29]